MRHWLGGITGQVRVLVFGMVLLVVVAGFTGLVGVTVATSTVDLLADEVVPAADANRAVLQDMTNAESALRGWVATDDAQFLAPYYAARTDVVREQLLLQQYADRHPSIAPEVARQDAAVDDWFASYAEPRLDLPAGEGNISHQRFVLGKEKFDVIRSANAAVASELDASVQDASRSASRQLPWIVLVLVVVAVLGAVGLLLARRFAGAVSDPLVRHAADRRPARCGGHATPGRPWRGPGRSDGSARRSTTSPRRTRACWCSSATPSSDSRASTAPSRTSSPTCPTSCARR